MNEPAKSTDLQRMEAIARLATLERLREQARESKRDAMLESVEKMIAAELRLLKRLRASQTG